MKPRHAALATLLSTLPAGARAQQPPSFEATRELVRIDVVALDAAGKPVRGLTADDFEVREKGKKLAITSFEAVVVDAAPRSADASEPAVSAPAPPEPERTRAFVALFDDVNVSRGGAARVRADLARFAQSGLGDGDVVTLVTTSGLRFTARTAAERKRLAAVVETLQGTRLYDEDMKRDGWFVGLTDYEAMVKARGGETDPTGTRNRDARPSGASSAQAALHYERAKGRAVAGLSAIAKALLALEGFRGRKSLIVYSEGYVRSPDVPQFDQVVELARRTRVSVYFADVFEEGGDGTTAEGRLPGMTESRRALHLDEDGAGPAYVAAATGGRAANTADQTVLFREAAEQAAAYYLIGFDPPDGKDGERKVEIRSRTGLRLLAPDRYFVGAPAAPADDASALRSAMSSMFDTDGVPFTVATGGRDGVSSTTFTVTLPRGEGDGPRKLDLRIEARPLGAGEPVRDASELTVPPGDRPARLTRELSLRPGAWQARVAVRDRQTGRVGSVLHTFEVKDASAGAP